jgi:hypothetical protein
MQKLFISLFLGAALLLGGLKVEAQHNYVKVHPTERVVERGKAPSANHVWVGSEWNWSGGQYVEAPGHWDLPPHGHHAWVAGHWAKASRGSYWVAGHWR